MKKIILFSLFLSLCDSIVHAGLITHSDYTSGNTITAAGQNTNENLVFNEFNGNIESVNIKDNTLVNADLSDSAGITTAKFSSSVVSTFTYVSAIGTYRRPRLSFVSATTVDIENNTGTTNQTCILFPDERRCVTENTGSTSQFRRFIVTESAALSGTWNSGLRSGYVRTINTQYALFAVKTTDNASNFVIVGDTFTAVQADYASLNTAYGINGWVYLGTIANGNNGSDTSSIVAFNQTGNIMRTDTILSSGNNNTPGVGLRIATTASAAALSWSAGTSMTSANPPKTAGMCYFLVQARLAVNESVKVLDAAESYLLAATPTSAGNADVAISLVADYNSGITARNTASSTRAIDIFLTGYVDSALGVGTNPQL